MKKLAGVLALACMALALSSFAYAAESKIGYVDFTKIQSESKAGKEAVKGLEKLVKDKQAQLDSRQTEIEKLAQEIEKQSAVLAPDARKQKEDKVQGELKELQRFKADSEEDLNKKRIEIATQMNDEVQTIINRFGKEEGYTLILDRRFVLYAPAAVDLTDRIIKAYDESKK